MIIELECGPQVGAKVEVKTHWNDMKPQRTQPDISLDLLQRCLEEANNIYSPQMVVKNGDLPYGTIRI